MKKVNLVILFIIINLVIINIGVSHAANWLADQFNSIQTNSQAFQSQKRKGFTGGSFSVRNTTSTENLFTAQPPSVSIGCGGIDMFMGSFSFLKPDMLVEKAKGIMTSAAYYMFQLALSELCEKCVNIMNKAQEIMDKLNSMQIDECGMGKKIATVSMDAIDSESEKVEASKDNLVDGITESFEEEVDKTESNPKKSFCDVIKRKYGNDSQVPKIYCGGYESVLKYVIHAASGKYQFAQTGTSLGLLTDAMEDQLRALIGDVMIDSHSAGSTGGDQLTFKEIAPCHSLVTLDKLIKNPMPEKTLHGKCWTPGAAGGGIVLTDIVRDVLMGLGSKMESNRTATISGGTETLINGSSYPLYSYFTTAFLVNPHNVTAYVPPIVEPVTYDFAYMLFRNMSKTLQMIIEDNVNGTSTAIDEKLNRLNKSLKNMQDNIKGILSDSSNLYMAKTKQFNETLNMTVNHASVLTNVESRMAQSFINGFGL